MSEEIAVVLVDDDSMVLGWVRMALEGSEFRVAGEAENGSQAVELLRRRHADVILVDYRLGDSSGADVLRSLRKRGVDTPALLMTANAEAGFNEMAREAGAQGTVLKTGSIEDLLKALRFVGRGGMSFDARHPRRPEGHGALTPRERDVLRLVAAGATNREIAEQLAIGGETVKTLLARTYSKLGVKRRAEAVAIAHEQRLL